MRSFAPGYELIAPRSLAEALERLHSEPGVWRPLAGGTDLMVLFEAGKLAHRKYLGIWNLAELRGIEVHPEFVDLGALTTYTEVRRSRLLQEEFPLLGRAAAETGGIATQNRGTLGGNIVNASPAADSPPALLVYDARLELLSAAGSRWVDYAAFHTGYKRMDLRAGELLGRIRLPRDKQGWRHYYRKVGPRKAQAISIVCFAGAAQAAGGRVFQARVALGSVAPTPIRCRRTETALRERPAEAAAALQAEISPIDDIRASAVYRRRLAGRLLEEFRSAMML
ncbi:MAG: FAD binding domain-containing protein [Acidobacteria bacterium]|nr:FAD binding domain-containing protein [Acidobacteriota bacterium]MBI3472139.1 FAD binding domain-containing protein [Candidatus Solibacter usitatus]